MKEHLTEEKFKFKVNPKYNYFELILKDVNKSERILDGYFPINTESVEIIMKYTKKEGKR